MTRAALVLLLLAGSAVLAAEADPKSLAIPPAEAERAAQLVGQLAGREYGERETATRELRKLGRLALPTLKETLASATNPEVRLRVELLLPAAVSADIRAKVECFLADKDGKFQHDLPGAKAFFAAAGRTDNAKKLFGEMIRSANRDLLVNADGPLADLERAYITRRNELGYATNNVVRPGVGASAANAVDMAALLFAETKLPDRGIGVAGPNGTRLTPLLMNYNFQTPFKSVLDNDPHKEALAAVLQNWMETREQSYSLYTAINFMQRFNMPNALPAARKLISGKAVGSSSPIYKANAMGYLARFGDAKTDLPVLEASLEDKGVVTTVFIGGPGNRQQQVQNRDVALAMAVLMTKQNPTDFGLVNRYGANPPESMKYNYYTYYFDGETPEKMDEKRDAATKKYKELKAKPPQEKKDEPAKK